MKLNQIERFVFNYSFNDKNKLIGFMFDNEGKQTKETSELHSLVKKGGSKFRDELLNFIYEYVEFYILNTEKKKNMLNILHGTRQSIVLSLSSEGCGLYYSNFVPLNSAVDGEVFKNDGYYEVKSKLVSRFFDDMK